MFKLLVRPVCLALMLAAGHAFAIDPTRPPASLGVTPIADETVVALRLQAILRTPNGARAVINGQSLKVGERLADARVLAIHPHSVLIERDGEQQELRLSAPIIKTSRTQP